MLEIKCPKCEAIIKNLVSDYLQWRSDTRKCPHCGTRLEISNSIFCFGLCGLIFGVVIGSSHYWDFGNEWLRLVIAVLICWAVMPVIIRIIGRWHVLSDEQKISRVVPVSILALAIVFGITYCVIRTIF